MSNVKGVETVFYLLNKYNQKNNDINNTTEMRKASTWFHLNTPIYLNLPTNPIEADKTPNARVPPVKA